ncbi:MAG: RNA-guided endonuclease InsQ/TnpB family protein, partial [Planctomycetota bacterium]
MRTVKNPTMIVTCKYKLYRSKKNKRLHDTISLAARAYNHCLALHKRYYKLTGKHLRIEKGYQLFFKSVRSETQIKVKPPTFKKSRKYKSYTLKQAGWKLLGGNKIRIGKTLYKFAKDREPVGKIKTVTIKRDKLGELYLCLSQAVPEPDFRPTSGKMAGFDFGLKTFLTVHDGFVSYEIHSPEFFKQNLNAIRQANRNLSGKKKGSNNWRQARVHLARVHKRV